MLNTQNFSRPVVFFANGIGDHIIALPALRALSNIFSGRLSLIAIREAYTEIFSDIDFESVWFIENSESPFHLMQKVQKVGLAPFDYEELAQQASGCDLFISLCQWTSPYLECLFEKLSPPLSVGFFPTFTHQLPDLHLNSFDTIFGVVHLFNSKIKIEQFSAPPKITKNYLTLIQDLKNYMNANKILIVHTDTKRRKMWSAENFLQTIDKFLSIRTEYIVIIVGIFNDLPLESADHKQRIFDVCRIPLGLSFALLSIADLFLGVDSCMLHAADLFRVPGVGIFSPTDPKEWGFRFAPHRHITADSITSITPEQVIDALMCL